jgi:hypothetical protein
MYVIWRYGLRGPTFCMITDLPLIANDNKTKMAEPIKLKPEEECLSLDELMKLYPAPAAPKEDK